MAKPTTARTKRALATIESLRREIISHDFHDISCNETERWLAAYHKQPVPPRVGEIGSKYEVKTWEVTDVGSFLVLTAEVGLKGDEGTAASLFARTRRTFFVGRGGGIQVVNAIDKHGRLRRPFTVRGARRAVIEVTR